MKIASRFGCFFGSFLTIAAGAADPVAELPYPLDIPGMLHHSGDWKATAVMLSDEMSAHINRSRWTKEQHELPEPTYSYGVDLDGGGQAEMIVHTGEGDPNGSHSRLILRDGKAEIIGAFRGSFGVVPREGGWAHIVACEPSSSQSFSRIGLHFDGSKYVRAWKYVQNEKGEAVRVDIDSEGDALPPAR